MAKHGVLFERDNFIPECINRGALMAEDVDGGAYVVLDKPNAKDSECYDVKKYTNEKHSLYVAYNPSVKYDVINGKKYPARSLDDRDYYNPANFAFDIFKPEVDVVFGILQHNIKLSDRSGLVVGDYLEPENGKKEWKKSPTGSGKAPTPDVPSFVIEEIGEVKYPTGDFRTEDKEKVFYVRTIQN